MAVLAGLLACAPLRARAQNPVATNRDPLISLMQSAPSIDTESPVNATAEFDPAVINAGGEAIYRVSVNALAESITQWPDPIPAPPQIEVTPGASGQMFRMAGTNLQPISVFNFRIHAPSNGQFTIPAFQVAAYGRPLAIPAATLQVVSNGAPSEPPQLVLKTPDTNVFIGQPVDIQVVLPSATGTAVQGVSQVELNGDGFLVNKETARQTIARVPGPGGSELPAYVYETTITPFVRGDVEVSAQGFTSGMHFTGPITIHGQVTIAGGAPQYALVESKPLTLHVRPVPAEGRLPGFTGAVGQYTLDPPRVSSRSVRTGEPLQLIVTFHGGRNVSHLVMPPPPNARDWQTFAAVAAPTAPSPPRPGLPGNLQPAQSFTFTFVPLTDDVRATPEIPFCYFDPERNRFVDLSIPSVPVNVRPGAAVSSAAVAAVRQDQSGGSDKPSLSAPSATPGHSAASMQPLQQRAWFPAVEMAPVVLFGGLWGWDRRRRFLELHPEIGRRRRARRALARERRQMRRAAQAGDSARFAAGAVNALRAVCAPHYPAEPRALVCADVLQLLPDVERNNGGGTVVRRLFDETDGTRFAAAPVAAKSNLLEMRTELDRVLKQLEARL